MLIQQVAKREILAILIHEEKKEVEGVETMLKDIIKIFKDEDVQLTNFNSAMKSLSGTVFNFFHFLNGCSLLKIFSFLYKNYFETD